MTNIAALQTKLRNIEALATPEYAPFKCAPILRANPAYPEREEQRRTHRTATATFGYIMRQPGEDDLGVVPPTYMSKADDLLATGRRHPLAGFPKEYASGPRVWQDADEATRQDEEDGTSAYHVILTLPDLPRSRWVALVERYVHQHLVTRCGMVVDWAIHHKMDVDGRTTVHGHAHLLCSARRYKNDYRRGERQETWFYNQAQRDKAEDVWLNMSGLPPKSFKLG